MNKVIKKSMNRYWTCKQQFSGIFKGCFSMTNKSYQESIGQYPSSDLKFNDD